MLAWHKFKPESFFARLLNYSGNLPTSHIYLMVPPEIGNLIAVIARLTNYNHHQIAKSQDKKIFDISKGFRSLTHFLVSNTFFTRKKKIYYRRNLVVTYITILDSMNFTLNTAIISFGKMIHPIQPTTLNTHRLAIRDNSITTWKLPKNVSEFYPPPCVSVICFSKLSNPFGSGI